MIIAGRIGLAAGLLAAWRLMAAVAGRDYVATPEDVVQHLWISVRTGAIVSDVGATVAVAGLGLLIGVALGVAGPVLLSRLPRTCAAVEPYVVGSAGIPKYALIPLLVMWFGIGDAPKVVLVILLVFYPTFMTLLTGVRTMDAAVLNMSRVCGARGSSLALRVGLPLLLPFLFAALRIAAPRAIGATIVSELLVGNDGVGHLIETARQSFDTTGVFGGIGLATMLVAIASGAVRLAGRRALFWQAGRPAV